MADIHKPSEVSDLTWEHFRQEIVAIQEAARPRNERAERLAGSVATKHTITTQVKGNIR